MSKEDRKIHTKGEGEQDFFKLSDNILMARAEASMDSVEKGNCRRLEEFAVEIKEWKAKG